LDLFLNSLLSLNNGQFNILSVFLSFSSSEDIGLSVSGVFFLGLLGLGNSIRVSSDGSMDLLVQFVEGLDFSVSQVLLNFAELLVVLSLNFTSLLD